MKSIYQNQCAELRQLFAQVSPDRILAVAIDFALDQHVVLAGEDDPPYALNFL